MGWGRRERDGETEAYNSKKNSFRHLRISAKYIIIIIHVCIIHVHVHVHVHVGRSTCTYVKFNLILSTCHDHYYSRRPTHILSKPDIVYLATSPF